MKTMHQTIPAHYLHNRTDVGETGLVKRFISYCEGQEKYRYGWLAVILTLHGCVLVPITLLLVFQAGGSIVLISMTAAAMAMSLITNLAALPTKVTIPVFFFSVFIDLIVIATCIYNIL